MAPVLRTEGGGLSRLSLPEIGDQVWCPRWLRDAMTSYLQAVNEVARPYRAAAGVLSGLLETTGSGEILDLASGAGGPWPGLMADLRRAHPGLVVRLSDLHPNLQARRTLARGAIDYVDEPVSALDVPADHRHCLRTIFTGLHHFEPEEVRTMLARAQEDRVAFAAFEATQRSARGVLLTAVIPLLVLALMPRVRPLRALPLLLTYLPPLLPFLIWWDGFASTVRTYSPTELQGIVDGIRTPGYSWKVEENAAGGGPIPMLQVVGWPSRQTDGG